VWKISSNLSKATRLSGRTFHDDQDLAEQCQEWLSQVNTERPSDATGEPPTSRLASEQRAFSALPPTAQDYGFFDCVVVNRESLVMLESTRYSVPTHLVGRALTARLHRSHIELFADGELVASHPRNPGHHQRVIDPAHFEEAFRSKPRGRLMVYRDWLCRLSEASNAYLREVCQRRYSDLTEQITLLYQTARKSGRAEFLTALELAAEQHMYGAEYLRAILTQSRGAAPMTTAEPGNRGAQRSLSLGVERNLAEYEDYVANRESWLTEAEARR
jgi:hypothetical protein